MSYFTSFNFKSALFTATAFAMSAVTQALNPPAVYPSPKPDSHPMSAGDVGALVGAVVGTAAFAVAAYFAVKYCRRNQNPDQTNNQANDDAATVFLLNNPRVVGARVVGAPVVNPATNTFVTVEMAGVQAQR